MTAALPQKFREQSDIFVSRTGSPHVYGVGNAQAEHKAFSNSNSVFHITSSPNESSLWCKLASGIAATCCQETATFTCQHVNCMVFHTLLISKASRFQQLSCLFGVLEHNLCQYLLYACLAHDRVPIFNTNVQMLACFFS